jgi:hypothetical protein
MGSWYWWTNLKKSAAMRPKTESVWSMENQTSLRDDMAYLDISKNRDLELLGTPAQLAALFAALSDATDGFKHIDKNRQVTIKSEKGNYTFNYAELSESIEATRGALKQFGLAISQPFTMVGNAPMVYTMLTHRDGGLMIAKCDVPEAKDIKGLGGNITYMRRYAYNAMLCLAADEDKDDQPEEKRGEYAASSGPRRTPDAPKAQPAATAARQAAQPATPRQETREAAPLASQPTPEPTSSGGSERPPAQTTAPTASESPPPSSGQELTDSEKKIASRLCQQGGCTNALQIRALIDKINGAADTKLGRANYRKTIVGLLSHLWTEKSGVSAADIDVFIGERAIDEVSVQETLAALAQQAQKAGA